MIKKQVCNVCNCNFEIKTSKKENKNKLVINKSYDMDDIKKLFSSNEEG